MRKTFSVESLLKGRRRHRTQPTANKKDRQRLRNKWDSISLWVMIKPYFFFSLYFSFEPGKNRGKKKEVRRQTIEVIKFDFEYLYPNLMKNVWKPKEEEKHFPSSEYHLRMNSNGPSTFYELKNPFDGWKCSTESRLRIRRIQREKNHPNGVFRKFEIEFWNQCCGFFLSFFSLSNWLGEVCSIRIPKRWSHFSVIKFRLNIVWELLTEKPTTVHPNFVINHGLRLLLFGKDERQQYEGFFFFFLFLKYIWKLYIFQKR